MTFPLPASRFPFVVVGSLAFVAFMGSATADDEICTQEDASEEDVFRTWVSWIPNPDGTLQTQFEIRALARPDTDYEIEGRINFGGDDVTWQQGPYFLSDEETSFIDVEIPFEAFMDEQQVNYTSTLVVRLIAYDAYTGEEIERLSAPRLNALWTGASEAPILYDKEAARVVAPGGIASEEIRADPNIVLEELGYIYEYAPQH